MADLLIVDDNIELGDMLFDILLSEGHEVRIARNGLEGVTEIRQRKPELILLDVEMPQLDGPGLAYQLFLHDAGEEAIPIILLSGIVSLDTVARRVGTPYFLTKPYSLKELFSMMELALLERRPPVPTSPPGPLPDAGTSPSP